MGKTIPLHHAVYKIPDQISQILVKHSDRSRNSLSINRQHTRVLSFKKILNKEQRPTVFCKELLVKCNTIKANN